LSGELFEKKRQCVVGGLSDIFRPFLIISGTNTLDYDFNFLPLAFLGGVLQCKEEKEK
jgi:hypothetical protein